MRTIEPTLEERRQAHEDYLCRIEPLRKALCDLTMRMPPTYVIEPDGSLTSAGRQYWPDWAIKSAESLEAAMEAMKSCGPGKVGIADLIGFEPETIS